MNDKLIPGHAFYIGPTLYLIPPLSTTQFKDKKLREDREFIKQAIAANGDITDELLDIGTRVVLAAANRNYPSLTAEELQDGVSPSALFAFIAYVLTPNMGQTISALENVADRPPGPLLYMSPSEPEVV